MLKSLSPLEKLIIFIMSMFAILLVFAVARSLVATKEGMTQGTLINVSIEGSFIPSCEIDVQYGQESSRIVAYSNTDTELCKQLKQHLGSTVLVSYKFSRMNFATNTNYIINSVKLIK